MSEKSIVGRTAAAFKPFGSPAVLTIATYTFGADPESTRPDRVMRIPSAAILLQRKGGLQECLESGKAIPFPRIALLGPSTRANIWATEPNTEFVLVNLAPGAARILFDLEPRDITGQVENLQRHALADRLHLGLRQGPAALHDILCSNMRRRGHPGDEVTRRARVIYNALHDRDLGGQVHSYADHFGVTTRTLQRMVKRETGLTPKQVLAVQRIRALIRLTARGWSQTIADLAQIGGYFDQSHLRYELISHEFAGVGELVGGDHVVVQHQAALAG
jgi:AraC-like DNA-binding protein